MTWSAKCGSDQPYLIAELTADVPDDVVTHTAALARDAGLLTFADRLQREHAQFRAS
jgi:hypothetical protein